MKLEFSADRVPGPRGSKIEYFLRKPRYRFVAATTSMSGVALLSTSWMMWPASPGVSIAALAFGLVTLLGAILWRKSVSTGAERYIGGARGPQAGLNLLSASSVAIVGGFVACRAAGGLCGNSDVKEFLSPDRTWKLVVYAPDCGATTGFSTHASVLPASASLPNDAGNAFTADSNHGRLPGVRVRWMNATTVELSHDAGARVFKAMSPVTGIDIRYTTSG